MKLGKNFLSVLLSSFVIFNMAGANLASAQSTTASVEEQIRQNLLEQHGGIEQQGARTFSLPTPKLYSKTTKFTVTNDRPLKVFVDAGHGGNNTTNGKRTPPVESVQEWYFNNAIASSFANYLKDTYKNVEINRVDQEYKDVSLATRSSSANNWGADIFISFHHNALNGNWHDVASASGSETYRYPGAEDAATVALTNAVHNAIVSGYGLNNRGVKTADFHVLRETRMPAVLVEGAFMDSNKDMNKLLTQRNVPNPSINTAILSSAGQKVADAIAELYGLEKINTPTPPKHTISFDLNGGTGSIPAITADEAGVVNSLPTKENVPAREGYEFLGWTMSANSNDLVALPLTVTGNTTLYAKWEEINTNYKVSFDLNGGTGTVPAIRANDDGLVVAASLPTKVDVPTREGYEFLGWTMFKQSDVVITFDLTLTRDTTLYAKWNKLETEPEVPNNYEITFDLNGGTGKVPAIIADDNGVVNSLPTKEDVPTREGYKFLGWSLAETGDVVKPPLTVKADTKLYAQWDKVSTPEPTKHTISFDLNGGTGTVNEIITDKEGVVTTLPAGKDVPTREGYKFLGWSLTKEGVLVKLPLTVEADTTLYAQWEKVSTEEQTGYTISFDLNGGTGTVDGITTDADGLVTKLPTSKDVPTREGYKFLGWSLTNDGVLVKLPLTVEANTTLYAQWEKVSTPEPTRHTISFDLNGGTGTVDKIITDGDGVVITLPTSEDVPTREGYKFLGWSLDEAGDIVGLPLTVKADTTLYAQWEKVSGSILSKFTVSFNLNGGNGNFPDVKVNAGDSFQLPIDKPTREGYIFLGWFTREVDGEKIPNNFTVNGDMEIHASWKKIVPLEEGDNATKSTSTSPKTGDLPNVNNLLLSVLVTSFASIIAFRVLKKNKAK